MSARVLITGGDGQLGQALCRQFGPQALCCGRQTLDVTSRDQVTQLVERERPDVVVNCAAYTNVDQAERDVAPCMAVNSTGTAILAEACRNGSALLVQISTDYVFGRDTARRTPYLETDAPAPLSVYGRSKLEGERHVTLCPRHLILRTCGLYGHSTKGQNFVAKILQLARMRDSLGVVDDQQCTPTYVEHLAACIPFLTAHAPSGIYHLVSGGDTNWYEFASEILDLSQQHVRLERLTSAQFGARAQRPPYSVLDTSKYRSLGGPVMPHWKDALREFLLSRSNL